MRAANPAPKRRRGAAWRLLGALALVFVLVMVSVLVLMVVGVPTERDAPSADRPHIVLILADDLGWNDVGYHGSDIATPHIDQIAREGIRLEQLYANPLCTVTRASLLTGRHAFRMGLQHGILKPWSGHGLPLDERTLPQALQAAGYRTHMLGKWHLGHSRPEYLPLQRGFDHDYGLYTGSIDYFTHRNHGGLDWHRDQQPLVEEGYATTLIGREAVRVIGAHDLRKPLFLYLAFNAPHRPMQVPAEQLARVTGIVNPSRRTYAAMVESMDDEIGRIVAALAGRGMLDETLVVFLSDNGGAPLTGASNRPYRAGKGRLHEGGIRVPTIVSWKGHLEGGRSIDDTMHVVDLYPTLLGLGGASREQPLPIDGIDLWPRIASGQPLTRDELVLYVWPAGGALRQGSWKLVITQLGRDATPTVELFDLASDPREQNDLAAQQPEKLKAMLARLDHQRAQARPAIENPPRKPADFDVPAVWGSFD